MNLKNLSVLITSLEGCKWISFVVVAVWFSGFVGCNMAHGLYGRAFQHSYYGCQVYYKLCSKALNKELSEKEVRPFYKGTLLRSQNYKFSYTMSLQILTSLVACSGPKSSLGLRPLLQKKDGPARTQKMIQMP